jgi:hypothetical protein
MPDLAAVEAHLAALRACETRSSSGSCISSDDAVTGTSEHE